MPMIISAIIRNVLRTFTMATVFLITASSCSRAVESANAPMTCEANPAGAATTPSPQRNAVPRPNIVLVITDDQGYGPIARLGHPWIRTPHLDSLHDSSTRFRRFLVSPTCSPTRSAIMTGRHSMKNGVTHTILERERMTRDAITLPEILRENGYETGIFGKWHLGDEDEWQPQQRGFSEAFIHGAGGIGQAYDCSCADAPDNSYFDPVIRHNGRFARTQGFCTDVFFSAAKSWIRKMAANDAPFFAYIATNAPHGPYLAPDRWKKRFLDRGFGDEQAAFYGMIENIDENVGHLVQFLDESRLLSDTVVIFMSDNGMTGGGSGRPGVAMGTDDDGQPMLPYNAGMRGLKGSVDEGGVRVPFFIRWDGKWEAGRDLDHVTGELDILPTLVSLAGGEAPQGQCEGRSLIPLLESPDADWPDRYFFTHLGRWPTGHEPDDYQWKTFSVRNHRFRLINGTELFDMLYDPGQTKNVIAQHPNVVSAMRNAYAEWWKETRPLMVNETAELSKTRPFHEAFRDQSAKSGIPMWSPE